MHARDIPSSSHRIGIGLVALAALLWSLNGALIKLVHEDGAGLNGVAIAFWRSVFAGLFLLPFAAGKLSTLWNHPSAIPQDQSIRTGRSESTFGHRLVRTRLSVLLCMLTFALMTTSFVVANTMTASANAIILQYTSTFWVFCLSPWILGEHAALRDVWVLMLALIGIGIIFAGSAGTDLLGLCVALSAGLFYGLLTMLLRRIRECDPLAVTVANNLGTAMVLLPAVLFGAGLLLSIRSGLLLVFMGVVQFGLPYYFFSLGLARIPARDAALISMAEPILVPIWAFLVVGDIPPRMTILGGSMVMLALLLFAWLRSRIDNRLLNFKNESQKGAEQ